MTTDQSAFLFSPDLDAPPGDDHYWGTSYAPKLLGTSVNTGQQLVEKSRSTRGRPKVVNVAFHCGRSIATCPRRRRQLELRCQRMAHRKPSAIEGADAQSHRDNSLHKDGRVSEKGGCEVGGGTTGAGQPVAGCALIDKGSVVVALLLAWLLLGETLSPAKVIGGGMMVGGLLIIARGIDGLRH